MTSASPKQNGRLVSSPPPPPSLSVMQQMRVLLVDEAMVLKLMPDIICSICLSPLLAPVETPCSHVFCDRCLGPALQQKQQCPQCRAVVGMSAAQPATAVGRMLSSLKVRCPLYADDGCAWTGSYSDLNTHVAKNCGVTPTGCAFCNAPIPRQKLPAHTEVCTRRPTPCTHCGTELPFSDIVSHIATMCPSAPVSCLMIKSTSSAPDAEIKGCGATVARKDLVSHQQTSCPKGIVNCDLHGMGCSYRGARETLSTHESQAALSHTKLMSRALITSQVLVEDLRAQVADLKAIVAASEIGSLHTMQAHINELQSLVDPSALYCFGGLQTNDHASLPAAIRLMPTGWENLPSMSVARKFTAATRCGEYIFVAGGQESSNAELAACERFHIKTKTWCKVAPLPTVRSCHAMVSTNARRLYATGGHAASATTVDVYDAITNEWKQGPPMITGRLYHCAAALGTRIYAIGGGRDHNMATAMSSGEVLDVVTNRWSAIAPMPTPRRNSCAVTCGDTILVLGGATPSGTSETLLDTIEEYTPATNTWRTLPWKLPGYRANFGACYHPPSQTLYIALGWPLLESNTSYYRRVPGGTEWIRMATPAPGLASFGAC